MGIFRKIFQPVIHKPLGSIQYSIIKDELQKLWDTCELDTDKVPVVKHYAQYVLDNKAQFTEAYKQTGVPAMLIGCLQVREADSLTNLMDYGLFNGQPWARRTTIVPKGQGPFSSWLEAAIAALKYDGLDKVQDWDITKILFYAEKFNGFGYRLYHPQDRSPYVWSCTNQNDGTGYYNSDGSYNAGAASENYPGIAAIIKYLFSTEQGF